MRHTLGSVLGVVLVAGLVAASCGGDDDDGASGATDPGGTSASTSAAPGPTDTPATTGRTGTTAAGAGETASGAGAAGIESDVRDVAGMFELDDGVAMFAERPADEDRTGITDDQILIGQHHPATGPAASFAMGPLFGALIDAVNEAGGVHGRQLVLEARDSAANPAQAAEVTPRAGRARGRVTRCSGRSCRRSTRPWRRTSPSRA